MENLTSKKTESKNEIDGMKSDLSLLYKKSQKSEGILNLSESDFKSEYGKKRYQELKSIPEGKNVRFNKNELEIIITEMENLIKGKEKELKAQLEKEDKDNRKRDIEMLNKNIQAHKGVANLSLEDFKSEYGKKRYQELKSIPEGKNVRFNKDELEIIAKELEDSLSDKKSIKKEKIEDDENETEDKKINQNEILVDNDEKISENEEENIKNDAKQKYLENAKKKMGVVNVEDIVEAEARKAADAYMTESKNRLAGKKFVSEKKTKVGRFTENVYMGLKENLTTKTGLTNMVKRIWKHTFFDEFYRQRQIARTREEIKTSGNVYAGRLNDKDKVAHESAMKGISDRFISEYDDILVLSKGEERKNIDNSDPKVKQATIDIKDLINEYASGKLNEESFKTSKDRILHTLNNQDLLKGTENYADNLFEIAENARKAIEHGAKLEELELDTNIIIGKAKSSLKTEAHLNTVDKLVDKMKKSHVGRLISPAVLNTSIGLAYSISVGVGSKFLRSKAAAWGTFGAAVGVSTLLAGANESQRLALERAQHDIEMAEGSTYEAGSKKREHLDKFAYQTESSSGLAQNLRNLMFEKDAEGKDVLKDIKPEDMDKILASLADIEARNSLNARNRIDLISYSNIANVEKERTDLTILTARAKVELRKKIASDFKDGKINGKSFDEYLKEQTETIENSLLGGESGITAQDKAFRKFKTKEVLKKMRNTAFWGLIFGATAQETIAFFKDNIQGVTEGMFNLHSDAGPTIQTPLEHLRSWMMGDPTHVPLGNPLLINLDGHELAFAEGTTIIENGDGSINILRGGNVISDHFTPTYDSSGALDEASLAELGKDGIVGTVTCNTIEGTKEVVTSANDYIENHNESTHKMVRARWYGNDTEMLGKNPDGSWKTEINPETGEVWSGADHNEIKGRWGGLNGTGINENGNYVLNHSRMTPDGSFQDGLSTDITEKIKAGGKVFVACSLTGDTQNDVFYIPVGLDGNAEVSPDSEIGKLFFAQENGHAVFKGRFGELVEVLETKDGKDYVAVIGTLEGPGNNSITDTVSTVVEVSTTNLTPSVETQPPMFIPIMSRKPLERLKEEENDKIFYYFGGSGFEESKSNKEKYRNELSETLKNNPDATLDQFLEIENYLKKQDKKYLKQVEDMANEMGPINPDCRLSVCIPVAGHQEGENIYQSLKNFSAQTIDKNKFEIVLFVNRPEKDKEGNIIKPDSTLSEINRFQKDYPDMSIKISDRVLPIENARIGYIRKAMNDAVLLRQYNRGKNSPELFIVSNDADNKGVSPQYIENFISKFDKDKNIDSMIGQLDWDPASYIRNPLIHIGTRLFLYNGTQSRFNGWHYNSSGANFAFRSSIYAAVGGYDGSLPKGGEDTDFGAKITFSREGANTKKPIAYAGAKASRLYTSSRRAEMAIEHGLAPIEQWDMGFSAFDDEVRKINWDNKGKIINYENEKEVKDLVSALEIVINRTINRSKEWGSSTKDPNLIRSLGWLGINYEITGPYSIKIVNADNLIKGLKQYKAEGMDLWRKKISNNTEKNKQEKNKEEKIKMEDEIEVFVNKFEDSQQKIIALDNLIDKTLDDDILDKIGLNTNIKEFKKQLIGLREIDDKDEFNKNVKLIFNPLFTAFQNNPKESGIFQRKAFIASHEFIPVNEAFSYGVYENSLHMHLAPASDLSVSEKFRLLKDALGKFAKVVDSRPDIKEISATSWIVSSNPGLFKKLGFKIIDLIDQETKNRDFPKETRNVGKAFISREDFLEKYNR